jgi:hypothetical protein
VVSIRKVTSAVDSLPFTGCSWNIGVILMRRATSAGSARFACFPYSTLNFTDVNAQDANKAALALASETMDMAARLFGCAARSPADMYSP